MKTAIYRIVLTGGPCGGKTTALSHIQDRFQSLGYKVYIVPELATTFILGGINPRQLSPKQYFQFQLELLKSQLKLEDSFIELANNSETPTLVVCDRGTMDSSAFTTPEMWQALLDDHNYNVVSLRDKRYDAIIHLSSAAVNTPEFYTLANNKARSESIKEAATLDLKIKEAWLGHPHLRVIDSCDDFNIKLKKVLRAVSNVIGAPEPIENERKFLVKKINDIPCKTETVEIEQTYLLSTEGIARIRKRGQQGSYSYTYTVKKFLAPGKNIELERTISGREYLNFLNQQDPERLSIVKKRTCFLWKNQYYELDQFLNPHPGLILLEAELEDEESVSLPEFLEIEKEVTDDLEYSNFKLAKIKEKL